MKTLVAGGAGFVGSWLCEKLLESNEVACLDNFSTGRKQNVGHIKSKEFSRIDADVTKSIKMEANVIFHLASPASPADYQKKPIETMMANSEGTKNLLELARKNDATFLLASTSEIYGDPLEHPQKETYWGNVNPTGPRSCYDEAKRFAEALTTAYHNAYGIDTKIIRIFNTYGPRMRRDDGRLIPNLITQALAGKPLTVYGSGKQTRSFCYVKDLVEGIAAVAFSKHSGEAFNLGNPDEHSVIDIAEKIKALVDRKLKLEFLPLPQDDPRRRKPDIAKVKSMVGWKPSTSLADGLAETIVYFRKTK